MKRELNISFFQALKLGVAALIVLLAYPLMAQVKFYAQVPKSVALNQTFQLLYVVENGQAASLTPPSLADFQVLSGPNPSQSVSIVNGSMSQKATYSYTVKPKKEGTFKIGKGTAKIAGVNVESNEVSIQVTAPVQQQAKKVNPHDPWAMFDDPFAEPEPAQQVSMEDIKKQVKDDVFIRAIVSKASAYKGEMLTVSYKLFFNRAITGYNVKKAPQFEGFWSQEVEMDPKRRPALETLNGKKYQTFELLKYNLYPQRAATLPISELALDANVQVVVQTHGPSFFNPYGRSQAVNVPLNLQSNSINITAKELPAEGKPADFTGAVGKYNFETNISGTETKTDEPLTYSVRVTGSGNLKFIDAPKLSLPPDFEVYDPKIKENVSNSTSGMSGSKQYDYLFIPRQPGEFKLPAQSFSYFDPATGKYTSINTKEFTITVTGQPSQVQNIANNTTNKQEVSELDKDIRYIKTSTNISAIGTGPMPVAAAAAYITPFFLLGGLVMLRKRNENLAADVVGTKRRKAVKLAQQRLSTAKKLLADNNKTGFYNEVSRAVLGYLGDKLTIDMAGLNKDNIEEQLSTKQVSAVTIAKLKTLLSTCEQALYSPVGSGNEMQVNYDTAINLVADLEGEIKIS